MIKEQNSLDALVMIEMCCHILEESTEIITNSRCKNIVTIAFFFLSFVKPGKVLTEGLTA